MTGTGVIQHDSDPLGGEIPGETGPEGQCAVSNLERIGTGGKTTFERDFQAERGERNLKKSHAYLPARPAIRYRFIHAHREEHSVVLMCQVLNVSKSGYYKWMSDERRNRQTEREKHRETLQKAIKEYLLLKDRLYGSPRIHRYLIRKGFRISLKTVALWMQAMGLRAVPEQRHVVTAESNHG